MFFAFAATQVNIDYRIIKQMMPRKLAVLASSDLPLIDLRTGKTHAPCPTRWRFLGVINGAIRPLEMTFLLMVATGVIFWTPLDLIRCGFVLRFSGRNFHESILGCVFSHYRRQC